MGFVLNCIVIAEIEKKQICKRKPLVVHRKISEISNHLKYPKNVLLLTYEGVNVMCVKGFSHFRLYFFVLNEKNVCLFVCLFFSV